MFSRKYFPNSKGLLAIIEGCHCGVDMESPLVQQAADRRPQVLLKVQRCQDGRDSCYDRCNCKITCGPCVAHFEDIGAEYTCDVCQRDENEGECCESSDTVSLFYGFAALCDLHVD